MANTNTSDVSARISASYESLSKGQKRLADYIVSSYEKAVYLTAARLGEEVGVSESTVVRFAMRLGFKGYPEFQRALEELLRNKLNSIQRMEVAYDRIDEGRVLETVLRSDAEKVQRTLDTIDAGAFDTAVDALLSARKIYVVGIRSCAPLAEFLCYYLRLMLEDVTLVETHNPSEIFEQMMRVSTNDVVVGISFPRYSLRTLKAVEFAKNRGANVITITDSVNAPMTAFSSCNLIAKSDMVSIVDSLVAPLSVINALIVAIGMRRQDAVSATLEELEHIWGEYQVYESDEVQVAGD